MRILAKPAQATTGQRTLSIVFVGADVDEVLAHNRARQGRVSEAVSRKIRRQGGQSSGGMCWLACQPAVAGPVRCTSPSSKIRFRRHPHACVQIHLKVALRNANGLTILGYTLLSCRRRLVRGCRRLATQGLLRTARGSSAGKSMDCRGKRRAAIPSFERDRQTDRRTERVRHHHGRCRHCEHRRQYSQMDHQDNITTTFITC